MRARRLALVLGLGIALVLLCLLGAGIGAFPSPVADVLASVAHRLGLAEAPTGAGYLDAVLWQIRFPRVLLGVLVGASLACAGAVMQGVFGNPLAEPAVVGVSGGAAMAASAVTVLGVTALGSWTLPAAAFIGGLVTVAVVYLVARSGGRTEVVTLVLTGIAVNAATGAVINLLLTYSNDAQLRSVVFWMMGSLASTTWPKVLAVLPCAIVGLLLAPLFARQLDLLALGERPARHLGVHIERLRGTLMFVVALLTAAAVAVAGMIGFVGLVVPHVVRMIIGPGHRFLIPVSALGGAVVVVAADLVARTVLAPVELPIGALTALVGGPFFFWLLRRTRASQGGWA
ncbi:MULTISPECIES: iron ABC transporter permease [unclassified Crossiella]|uniref:FecCD family ABC transporter permease n=1 Tax=unclassified Crossiella TaxID=2620835 RepID=UPI001FFE93CE|nr:MULTISPECIES: iron ABC transporter permease [unclassified Crossiella]MCK2237984.1 iron ABC transporter permease [Crossiella sp. S99.2]MCK2255267.1 iron ABC transporter permease [Crossiella sp. S99.1]